VQQQSEQSDFISIYHFDILNEKKILDALYIFLMCSITHAL